MPEEELKDAKCISGIMNETEGGRNTDFSEELL